MVNVLPVMYYKPQALILDKVYITAAATETHVMVP